MTREIFENEEIKILSYWNGERKVYQIILNGAKVEILHRGDEFKRLLEQERSKQ